jgi:hypothetical protein
MRGVSSVPSGCFFAAATKILVPAVDDQDSAFPGR